MKWSRVYSILVITVNNMRLKLSSGPRKDYPNPIGIETQAL